MLSLSRTTLLAFGLATALAAQAIPGDLTQTEQVQTIPNRYIVQFAKRGFTLEAYRNAIYSHQPAARVDALVTELEGKVEIDQRAFVDAITKLGGTVTHQWWLINGAAVTLDASLEDKLRAMPNVAFVEAELLHHTNLAVASNASNHNSAAANLKRDAQNRLVTGQGVTVAVLDTGSDANMGGTGRPHRSYFPGGNPANTSGGGISGSLLKQASHTSGYGAEDQHGHGTAVASCVAGNKWSTSSTVGAGMAPGAGIHGINISAPGGGASTSWIIAGWQTAASAKATHNTLIGNLSFSGSPNLASGSNVAMDSAAYNSDILPVTAAGNSQGTSSSPNPFNGIAVGWVSKTTLSVSGSSPRGPLQGYSQRTYPDIMAVGVQVRMTRKDSESSTASMSGSSFASPMVAGAAALVRQANPNLTALETKAILLNTSRNMSTNRNLTGLGFMKADGAVQAALDNDIRTGKLTSANRSATIFVNAPQIVSRRFTVTWQRNPNSSNPPHIDMQVYGPTGALAGPADVGSQNSYASVLATTFPTGMYRIVLTSNSATTVEYAISGAGAPAKPVLSSLSPTQVSSWAPGPVTLTGTGLDSVSKVVFDSTTVSQFTVISATEVTFTPPGPSVIGAHQVKVEGPGGVSASISIQVTGNSPAIVEGTAIAVRGFAPGLYGVHGMVGESVILFSALSQTPSSLPGIVSLQIGGGFSTLFQVGAGICDNTGQASFSVPFPKTLPQGIVFPFQAVVYDAQSIALPLATTGVIKTTVY